MTKLTKSASSSEKRNAYQRRYNAKHRELINQRQRERTRQRKLEMLLLHGSTECERCGEDRPHCLSFHHRDPSTKDHSYTTLYNLGEQELADELEKCDVLCLNCHADVHFQQNGRG